MAPVAKSASTRRKPKGDKRQRTRGKLLEAARELIREQGYERITLADVAKRAGMTTGAIYGNFRNRDELFIALGQAYWAPIQPQFKPHSSFAEKMRAFAAATIAAIPDRRAAATGRLAGIAHALSNEELRAQVSDVTAKAFAGGADWLRTVADRSELPMSADNLVRVIYAMTEGLVIQRILTPELYPDKVFYAAFGALAVKSTPPGKSSGKGTRPGCAGSARVAPRMKG
jgi:AcrR family transcriptional regulator